MTTRSPTDHGELSWRHRPRTLRRQLVWTLVFVAFVSVAIVGGLNFYAATRLLADGTEETLSGIGEAQARSIETGVDRLLGQVSAIAADLAVVQALEELNEGYRALDEETLTDEQSAELDAFYDEQVIQPIDAVGLGPVTLDEVAPGTDSGRYVQYHYTVPTTDDTESARDFVDAGDGSDYSEAHARGHSYLAGLAASLGASDLLLVSADGQIVYTVEKRIDVGTDLADGPYRDTVLADTVLGALTRVRVGGSVVADYELYLPLRGRPALFVASAIRRETEIIGSIVVQVPIEAINATTAADGRWEEVGLRGGEIYVVGSDLILRSESRRWIEDPDGYLDDVGDEALADLIQVFGSPVGLQPVDTKPVREAFEGGTFEGTARNYLGSRTFTYATPIDVAGVDWVAVADIPLGEARSPLYDFLKQLGLVLLIILPAAGLIGIVLANRLTRPIPPVVDAAAAIAAGERDPRLPDLGRDEFGDLARRLVNMADELGNQEAALAEESRQTREMLLTVLPPRLVDSDGHVVGTGDTVDTATVVAVWIDLDFSDLSVEGGIFELVSEASQLAENLVLERGMERIRVAADHYLFIAGIGSDDDRADDALEFATDLAAALGSLAEREEMPIAVHIGLSTGRVATGMLERGSLTFAAWGEPVRRALAIGALTTSEEVVVDATTADAATAARWELEPTSERHQLDGESIGLFRPRRRHADSTG